MKAPPSSSGEDAPARHDDIMRGLGEIAAQFAMLEWMVELCCQAIGGHLPAGCELNTINAQHAFTLKIDRLKTYFPWFLAQTPLEAGWSQDRFDTFMAQCTRAADDRNKYAHAVVMDSISAATGEISKAIQLAGKVRKLENCSVKFVGEMFATAKRIDAFASEGASLLVSLRQASETLGRA